MKIFLALLLFSVSYISAEIKTVTISWRNINCPEQCIQHLEKFFYDHPPVATVRMNQGGGNAVLTWKPNQPFEYQPVNYAVRRIGLSANNVRIKLTGTISHFGDRFYITSLGDGTRIELLSAPASSKTDYVEKWSYFTHTLSPGYQNQFLDAQRRHLLVTVEGPLFEPDRPPLKMDVESVEVHRTGS